MARRLTTKRHYITEPGGPDVVDGTRKNIVDYLSEHPDTHFSKIGRDLGVKNGNLSHHLHVLKERDIIKSKKEGGIVRYSLVNGFDADKEARTMDQDIIGTLGYEKGLQVSDITMTLGISTNAVFTHLKRLEQEGTVEHLRDGYFKTPKAAELYKSSKRISLKATSGCRLQLAEM